LRRLADFSVSLLSHPRFRRGIQGLDEVATELAEEVSQAFRETYAEVKELVDANTGLRIRTDVVPLWQQMRTFPPHPLSVQPARAQTQTAQLPCLRCGATSRANGRFCFRCGSELRKGLGQASFRFHAAILSDRGKTRPNNEDDARLWMEPGGQNCLALVADGMGGEASGEVASRQAAEAVKDHLQQHILTPDLQVRPDAQLPQALVQGIQRANMTVYGMAEQNPTLGQMGTTMTLALVRDDCAYLAHVGDSRAYLITREGQIWQITHDHTLVSSLVAAGLISQAEAERHPQRNLLYRCLGQSPTLVVDSFVRRLEEEDSILICSDGLIRHVNPTEIAAEVTHHSTPEAACTKLVSLANSRGGEDNISVIIIRALNSGGGR
jgi:protein phosphatase